MTTIEVDVVIQCSDPSHEPKVCKVAGYVRSEDGGWTRAAAQDAGPENRTTFLTGDVPLDDDASRGGPLRQRDNLECRLCGIKLPLRAERREEWLEPLYANGVTCVELRHLARTLS